MQSETKKTKKMKISEIFYSIQGEGKYTGTPSIFIRTSYCNLRCGWCDTPYTSHYPENKEAAIEEIMIQMEQYDYASRFLPHIVLTGGEPFIQANRCIELCEAIHRRSPSAQITVETNGTIFAPVQAELISISPKLSSSAPVEDQTTRKLAETHERLRQELKIDEFKQKYDCQFKFVVTKPSDIKEILYIVDVYKIPQHKVYLMPEGITDKALKKTAKQVVDMCLNYGFNYSDRIHVRLWDNMRGV